VRLRAVRAPLFLGLFAIGSARASEDTLRYYLSKSELSVTAEIVSDPVTQSSADGVSSTVFQAKVIAVLIGDATLVETIVEVRMDWRGTDEDKPSNLERTGKCILFLAKSKKESKEIWQTVDTWFGFQSMSRAMAAELSRLASDDARETSTPQECWKNFIAALKLGEIDHARRYCTNEGCDGLLAAWPTREALQRKGDWLFKTPAQFPTTIDGDSVWMLLGNEPKVSGVKFQKLRGRWKISGFRGAD
jgi:hypothetical protein